MKIPDWTREMFLALDGGDVQGFMSFLAEDVSFRFGNGPAVSGRVAVQSAVGNFLSRFESISHLLEYCWLEGERMALEGQVAYHFRDGRVVDVPFVDVFQLREGKILQYLIFIDLPF